jgi:VCBS repeat-containing protein
MAFQLSFEDANKDIKLSNLFDLPREINYNKFIGLNEVDLKNLGLNPFNIPQTAVLGPVGTATDIFSKVTGYDIGLYPQVSLKKIGLQLDASFNLGSLNLNFPWAQAGGLGLRLDGNNLVVNSGIKLDSQLINADVKVPSLKLATDFPIELSGSLDLKVGSKTYDLVDTVSGKFTYDLLNFGSDKKVDNEKKEFKQNGFKASINFPTVAELTQLLKPTVSSKSISLSSSIKLLSLDASILDIVSNAIPLLKVLSSSKDFGAVNVDWKLLEGTIGGEIKLDLGATLNFGKPTAWLKFEDDSISDPIDLSLSSFTLPNILKDKLDKNNDGKASIQVQLGFNTPSLQGKAGLSSTIFVEPTIGYAKVGIDGLGSQEIGPIYQEKFPLFDIPLDFAGGSYNKSLPSSLSPTVTFQVDLPLEDLQGSTQNTVKLAQIDGSTAVLRGFPFEEKGILKDPKLSKEEILNLINPFIDKWGAEDTDKIFIARKAKSNSEDDPYVLYKSSELNSPESSDEINPYLRSDLVTKSIALQDRQGKILTYSNPFKDDDGKTYIPIAAELDPSDPTSKRYSIIFRQTGYIPAVLFQAFQAGKTFFYRASGVEENTVDGRSIKLDSFNIRPIGTNTVAGLEKFFNEDLNGTGVLEPGELISGNISGTALWKDKQGYWIGDSKSTPTNYLSDPLGSPLPGTPIAFVSPQNNFVNPKYRGVIFQNGFGDKSEFHVWNVNESNEKVSESPSLESPLSNLQLGDFEYVLNQDLNGDTVVGAINIIDSDINKVEYTILSELIKPFPVNNQLYRDAYYVINEKSIKIPGYEIPANIFLTTSKSFNLTIESDALGTFINPDGSYGGRNGGTEYQPYGWTAIAATINTTLSTSKLKILDVMWKNQYAIDNQKQSWLIWRFEIPMPSESVAIPEGYKLFAYGDNKRANHKFEYLNNPTEVSMYEGQFDEDFNGDGFYGRISPIENSGKTVVNLVDGHKGKSYQIKEESDPHGIKLQLDTGDYDIPYSSFTLFPSTWTPIAVERISNTFALAELTQAGRKNYDKKNKYYYGLGVNPDGTYSLRLFSNQPSSLVAVNELEWSVDYPDSSAYEEIFDQDLNYDGKINKISRSIELFGQTNLSISNDGYIIDNQGKRIYLKSSTGAIVTPQSFDGLPVGIEKTDSAFQLVRLRNATSFELLEIDNTGRIQSSRFLDSSEFVQYASFLQQPLDLNQSITATEDTAIIIRLFSNDSSINRDTLVLKSLDQPSNGTLTDNKDGTVTYQPNSNFNGSDSFSYTISDGTPTSSSTATVFLIVAPINNPATISGTPTASVTEDDSTLTLTAIGSLSISDADVGENQFSPSVSADPNNLGTLSITSTGTFTYSVANSAAQYLKAGQTKTETFTVKSLDGTATQDIVITLNGINDAPVADPDKTLTLLEDASPILLNIAAPTDIDGDTLTTLINTIPDSSKGTIRLNDGTVVTAGQSLTLEQLTGLVFAPVANANGSAGNFSYTVSDGQGGSASQTVALTITPDSNGGSWGDPHIFTFDQFHYDFQATGDFVLMRALDSDLQVQVRQTPWDQNLATTINTGLATLVDGNRLEFYVDRPLPLVNNKALSIQPGETLALGQGSISRTSITGYGMQGDLYTVTYPNGDVLYNKVFSGFLIDPTLDLANSRNVVGLLGNNNGNAEDDLALSDGTILSTSPDLDTLHGAFADSWRVSDAQSFFSPVESTLPLNLSQSDLNLQNDLDRVIQQLVVGGNDNDTLIGITDSLINPGKGEIDLFMGNKGADTFVLGDQNNRYYVGLGQQDYALITDLWAEDKIQLHGSASDYILGSAPSKLANGTGIFLASDPNELIGIIQGDGMTNLNLSNRSMFEYV